MSCFLPYPLFTPYNWPALFSSLIWMLLLVHFGLVLSRTSSISLPLYFKISESDFSSLTHGQSCLVKTQLTNVQVILASYQQKGRPSGVQLHLACNPLSIKMCIPVRDMWHYSLISSTNLAWTMSRSTHVTHYSIKWEEMLRDESNDNKGD